MNYPNYSKKYSSEIIAKYHEWIDSNNLMVDIFGLKYLPSEVLQIDSIAYFELLNEFINLNSNEIKYES